MQRPKHPLEQRYRLRWLGITTHKHVKRRKIALRPGRHADMGLPPTVLLRLRRHCWKTGASEFAATRIARQPPHLAAHDRSPPHWSATERPRNLRDNGCRQTQRPRPLYPHITFGSTLAARFSRIRRAAGFYQQHFNFIFRIRFMLNALGHHIHFALLHVYVAVAKIDA